MRITHESSMAEFERLIKTPKPSPIVPLKPLRADPYAVDGISLAALVRSDDRNEGIKNALRLIGGTRPLTKGVKGEIIIKPNCNHDMPFPRNSHPETVSLIAESLIADGFDPGRIAVGDMSGMYRGLPTRVTMENLGLNDVAEDLGLQISCFEDEDWVTVDDTGDGAWPEGMKLPKRIYEAGRIIMTPILRPHTSATFSMSMKLAVGMMDAKAREWLHNGERFYEKLMEFNLAFTTDLTVVDGLKCYVDKGPSFTEMVEPGITLIGSNRVATDAVAVAILKKFNAYGLETKPILEHEQIKLAERLSLGNPKLENIDLRTENLAEDSEFETLITQIKNELGS